MLKKFSKGDFIIKENDYVQDVYLISSGLVKLFYTDYDSKEHILSFAFEDWWETDFSAFYNKERAVFSLQCIEDTEAYSLSYDDFFAACQNFTQLTDYFLAKSIRGHIANQKRILSLLTLNPKERYELFLQIYPSLSQRISKSVLASYLGVSRETLSRLYKQHK
ncbi:Crp/Fnr family transcriptional regulator [Epilithonimonas hungarica]|uniref:Crp/Fnr family transcriptional regulator n=1 Tax=Epilithonimonas hungarica TaxID=454006 RepID=UPI001FE15294|nr:Crp/Fnr family transcriptional regulator [Epilithonimonas hungarica]